MSNKNTGATLIHKDALIEAEIKSEAAWDVVGAWQEANGVSRGMFGDLLGLTEDIKSEYDALLAAAQAAERDELELWWLVDFDSEGYTTREFFEYAV